MAQVGSSHIGLCGLHTMISYSFPLRGKGQGFLAECNDIVSCQADLSKPICSSLSTVDFVILLAKERVATAGVSPDVGKGDFAGSPLLEEELVLLIEEENAESPMKYALGLGVVKSVHIVLASSSQNLVCLVHCDALVCSHEVMLTARA